MAMESTDVVHMGQPSKTLHSVDWAFTGADRRYLT